jgi:hypothetical protein
MLPRGNNYDQYGTSSTAEADSLIQTHHVIVGNEMSWRRQANWIYSSILYLFNNALNDSHYIHVALVYVLLLWCPLPIHTS